MPHSTATETASEKEVLELTVVEISFYDHEFFAGQKLIARIAYNDDLTQPWVVMVNGEEVHRANTWAKCSSFITWHYKQGTLPEQQQEELATTTGNEVMVQIAQECEKYGFELLDDGIHQNDRKLGSVGCTDGKWWVIRASSEHQQKVPCDSAMEAVWSLWMVEALGSSCEELLDRAFEELTAEEWRRLLEYQPASQQEFLAA